jgi:hypothetical protein
MVTNTNYDSDYESEVTYTLKEIKYKQNTDYPRLSGPGEEKAISGSVLEEEVGEGQGKEL